jgi:hypothetical protein
MLAPPLSSYPPSCGGAPVNFREQFEDLGKRGDGFSVFALPGLADTAREDLLRLLGFAGEPVNGFDGGDIPCQRTSMEFDKNP